MRPNFITGDAQAYGATPAKIVNHPDRTAAFSFEAGTNVVPLVLVWNTDRQFREVAMDSTQRRSAARAFVLMVFLCFLLPVVGWPLRVLNIVPSGIILFVTMIALSLTGVALVVYKRFRSL